MPVEGSLAYQVCNLILPRHQLKLQAKNIHDQSNNWQATTGNATEQHIGLKHALAQQCHKVSLHTILIAVMGTIYKCHTELPLSKLGLDW